MKRLLMASIFVGLIAGFGIGFQPARISAQTTNFNANLCSMPQTGTYSPGAVETRNSELYRCSFIFDSNLRPSGVAWIKMETQTVYIPKTRP